MDYSKLVESLKKQDANRKCFDCGVVGTTYASLNFGTFVCSQCAGILRGLNFKVKPLGISIFTLNEYEILQKNGNEKAKYIWMGLFDPYKHEKPDPKNYNDVKKHLIKKYKEKQFFRESKDEIVYFFGCGHQSHEKCCHKKKKNINKNRIILNEENDEGDYIVECEVCRKNKINEDNKDEDEYENFILNEDREIADNVILNKNNIKMKAFKFGNKKDKFKKLDKYDMKYQNETSIFD